MSTNRPPAPEGSDLDTFQRIVGEWQTRTFPNADNISVARHLEEEAAEVVDAAVMYAIDLSTGYAPEETTTAMIQEEAADCLLLLMTLANRNGFSLFDAAQEKFAINQQRTWNVVADGGYTKHGEEPTNA
jgi:NTP pyrophosphatase (non-canonical NTP hydrolase)